MKVSEFCSHLDFEFNILNPTLKFLFIHPIHFVFFTINQSVFHWRFNLNFQFNFTNLLPNWLFFSTQSKQRFPFRISLYFSSRRKYGAKCSSEIYTIPLPVLTEYNRNRDTERKQRVGNLNSLHASPFCYANDVVSPSFSCRSFHPPRFFHRGKPFDSSYTSFFHSTILRSHFH